MPADIGASTQQFSTAVSIFYATYVTFETPSAILLKKLTPRFFMTALTIVWSLTTIFSGFIENVGGLYATRLILGACEAGLFPSLNLYLTMVYRREEQAKRVGYLFSCAAISGAFGGLLAYGLLQMDGISGLAGWRCVMEQLSFDPHTKSFTDGYTSSKEYSASHAPLRSGLDFQIIRLMRIS
jgi:MFS family permease